MRVSVIITTYNWVNALEAVLKSLLSQTVLPYEVIIADDGSGHETRELIEKYQQQYPIPLHHSWQPDKGFRAAESRNKAVAQSTGEYIIIVDGDIYLPATFIEDHIFVAKPGCFVQAGRVSLGPALSEHLMLTGVPPKIWQQGMKNRKNMLRCKRLSKVFSRVWNSDASTRSCNMAFWRQDMIDVNGFNNDFVGWGREDSELVIRLLNHGLQRLYIKFLAAGYHLYHQEHPRESLEANQLIFEQTKASGAARCRNGLDKFL